MAPPTHEDISPNTHTLSSDFLKGGFRKQWAALDRLAGNIEQRQLDVGLVNTVRSHLELPLALDTVKVT
jgi:hypothetical protein